ERLTGPGLELYLSACDGETVTGPHTRRPAPPVRRPALTLGLAVPPDLLGAPAAGRRLHDHALLDCFLFALPPDLLGLRQVDAPSVPERVRDTYHRALTALLELPAAPDRNGRPAPHLLTLSGSASRLFV